MVVLATHTMLNILYMQPQIGLHADPSLHWLNRSKPLTKGRTMHVIEIHCGIILMTLLGTLCSAAVVGVIYHLTTVMCDPEGPPRWVLIPVGMLMARFVGFAILCGWMAFCTSAELWNELHKQPVAAHVIKHQ
jgi:hypothetical protein